MGKANPRNANGNARRKLRARLRAEGRPCHICGMPIDYGLPAGDPWSFEVDELVPVSRGGDPLDYSNVDAAHRICNQRRGNRMDGDEGAKGLPIVRSRLFSGADSGRLGRLGGSWPKLRQAALKRHRGAYPTPYLEGPPRAI